MSKVKKLEILTRNGIVKNQVMFKIYGQKLDPKEYQTLITLKQKSIRLKEEYQKHK